MYSTVSLVWLLSLLCSSMEILRVLMANWSNKNRFFSHISHISIYTQSWEYSLAYVELQKSRGYRNFSRICFCLGNQIFDVLPNGGKMSNSLLLYLKNRWKHGRSLRPLQQNLVWVENEDFCFKLPAAYVRLTLLLCF